MRVFSTFSGISAASVAWRPLGYQFVGYAEVEPFPAAVLAARCGATAPRYLPEGKRRSQYKHIKGGDVPNFGDVTQVTDADLESLGPVDVLEGGSPCQAFSVAGMRAGLADERGNLTLEFVRLALRMRRINGLKFVVWENVKGVLNHGSNPFGCLLGALVGEGCPLVAPGGKWTNAGHVAGPEGDAAWRVLDAQYWGVPQRRERVFAVAGFGDRPVDPGTVLFEPQGGDWNPSAGGEAREAAAGAAGRGAAGGRGDRVAWALCDDFVPKGAPDVAYTILAGSPTGGGHRQCVAHPVETVSAAAETGRGWWNESDVAGTLRCGGGGDPKQVVVQRPVVAFMGGQGARAGSLGESYDVSPTLRSGDSGSNRTPSVVHPHPAVVVPPSPPVPEWLRGRRHIVRRLMPVECERLQGFPDGWTDVEHRRKPAADGPRYRALGNSMSVPCMRFIGRRLLECAGEQNTNEKEEMAA